jgi:hypothetical protein
MKRLIAAFKELQEATTDHDSAFKEYERAVIEDETWATWGMSLGWGKREVDELQDATVKFEGALNIVIDERIQKAIAKLA